MIEVIGQYNRPDGYPATGKISLVLDPEERDVGQDRQWTGEPVTAELDEYGRFSLVVTTDTRFGLGRYRVNERIDGLHRTWHVCLGPGTVSPINLPDLWPGNCAEEWDQLPILHPHKHDEYLEERWAEIAPTPQPHLRWLDYDAVTNTATEFAARWNVIGGGTNQLEWVQVGTGVRVLDDLLDVNTTVGQAPQSGDTLIYNGTDRVWRPGRGSGGGGSAEMIDQLLDVDTSTVPPLENESLTWQPTLANWVPTPVLLVAGVPQEGDVLVWDSAIGAYVPVTPTDAAAAPYAVETPVGSGLAGGGLLEPSVTLSVDLGPGLTKSGNEVTIGLGADPEQALEITPYAAGDPESDVLRVKDLGITNKHLGATMGGLTNVDITVDAPWRTSMAPVWNGTEYVPGDVVLIDMGTPPADGDTIVWDATTVPPGWKYEPSGEPLPPGTADGDVPVWDPAANNGEGAWIPEQVAPGVEWINQLADVDTLTLPPVAGDVLAWDGLANWIPSTISPTGAPIAMNDLSDADTVTTPPTAGQVLAWDGVANWKPSTLSPTGAPIGSIDEHTDVDTTTRLPVSGNVLGFDGIQWVPTTSQLTASVGANGVWKYKGPATGADPGNGFMAITDPATGPSTIEVSRRDADNLVRTLTVLKPGDTWMCLDDGQPVSAYVRYVLVTPVVFNGNAWYSFTANKVQDTTFIATFAVDDRIQVETTLAGEDGAGGTVVAGAGLGESPIGTLNVGAGVGVAVAADTVSVDRAQTDLWYAPLGDGPVEAGLGLVETTPGTHDVGAGVGIAVSTDAVSIDRVVTDTWYAPAGSTGGGTPGWINDLQDVDTWTTPPSTGQALIWDGAGNWKPGTVTSGGIVALPSVLPGVGLSGGGDLDAGNVTLSVDRSQTDLWYAAIGSGGAGPTNIDSLTDVDTTTVAPAAGNALVWDGTSQWKPGTASPLAPGAPPPQDGWVITWDPAANGGLGGWVPEAPATGGVVALPSVLPGVGLSGGGDLDAGDATLAIDRTVTDLWYTAAGSAPAAQPISWLTDVDTITRPPAQGDVLTWNGLSSNWTPEASTGGGGGGYAGAIVYGIYSNKGVPGDAPTSPAGTGAKWGLNSSALRMNSALAIGTKMNYTYTPRNGGTLPKLLGTTAPANIFDIYEYGLNKYFTYELADNSVDTWPSVTMVSGTYPLRDPTKTAPIFGGSFTARLYGAGVNGNPQPGDVIKLWNFIGMPADRIYCELFFHQYGETGDVDAWFANTQQAPGSIAVVDADDYTITIRYDGVETPPSQNGGKLYAEVSINTMYETFLVPEDAPRTTIRHGLNTTNVSGVPAAGQIVDIGTPAIDANSCNIAGHTQDTALVIQNLDAP